ncbi:MAG: hypothetical protein ACKO3C_13090 [Betaproteobacteria bacterium]|nr:hypothetical protein [Betaproteobacteria bacterium]
MAVMLIEVGYAPEAMAMLVAQGENRQIQVERMFEAAGCRLLGAWYLHGTNRAILIAEGGVDDVHAVATVALGSRSLVSCSVTQLTAFSNAKGYFARAQAIRRDLDERPAEPSFLRSAP